MALGNPKWHFFEDYKTIENFGLIKWNSGMGDGVQPKHILIMGGWARVCVLVTPPERCMDRSSPFLNMSIVAKFSLIFLEFTYLKKMQNE